MTFPILSIITLLLFVFSSRRYKIQSFVYIYSFWCTIILLDYYVFQNVFVPFSKNFDVLFFFFSIFLLFSFIISYSLFSINFTKLRFPKYSIYSYEFYFVFTMIVAFFSIFKFIFLVSTNSFNTIRAMITDRTNSFHIGISFPLVASLIFYMNENSISKKKLFVEIVLIILAFISLSKIFIILSILYVVPWRKKGFKLKIFYILAICLLGFSLVFLLHIVTSRVTGDGNIFQKTIYTINGYFLGGLAAFQLYIDNTFKAAITTGGWVKTGKWIGNVYSAFFYFYAGHNFLRLVIIGTFLGFLYGLLKQHFIINRFIYIYSIYPILFIFFSDLFLPSIKQWFMFLISGIGVTLIKSKKNRGGKQCQSVQ